MRIIKQLQVNEQIRDKEARIISEQGEQLGIMPVSRAIILAQEDGLDLVKISQSGDTAVCKIMDYGKYKFEQAKKEKEHKKNQKIVELKEIQLSIRIEKHDWDFKLKHAEKFLSEGNKVKVVVKLRGREQAFAGKAIETANKFCEDLKDFCNVEKPAEKLGRNVILILNSLKK